MNSGNSVYLSPARRKIELIVQVVLLIERHDEGLPAKRVSKTLFPRVEKSARCKSTIKRRRKKLVCALEIVQCDHLLSKGVGTANTPSSLPDLLNSRKQHANQDSNNRNND